MPFSVTPTERPLSVVRPSVRRPSSVARGRSVSQRSVRQPARGRSVSQRAVGCRESCTCSPAGPPPIRPNPFFNYVSGPGSGRERRVITGRPALIYSRVCFA